MAAIDPSENLKPKASCKHKWRARPYQFQGDTSDRLCVVCAVTYRRVVYRTVCVALVGTILMLISQDDVLLAGSIAPLALLKIGLAFVLLYSTCAYSLVSSKRAPENHERDSRN